MLSAKESVVDAEHPSRGKDFFALPERRKVLLSLVLVAATLAVYNPVARNRFVNFDDNYYITKNSHVQAGLTGATIKWAFTTYEFSNWHPLTWISHALDCQLFKLNPAGHHYMNLLLHTGNVVLLFLLLQGATGSAWASFVVAAIFALHPVNVESVAWVSERKNVLSMLFLLLTLLAYGRYERSSSIARYMAVMISFSLGLMAKPQIITLPFLLLLWDYWPLQRLQIGAAFRDNTGEFPRAQSLYRLGLEKIPLLLLAAASALLTLRAQIAGGAVQSSIQYSLRVRLENAIVAYARYLGKALWPSGLSVMYPHPGNSLAGWQIAASSFLILSITVLVVLGWRHRYLPVGWFWFLGALVPMIGIVQVGRQAMADRYAYLPFIGLFLMVTFGLAEAAAHLRLGAIWLAAPAIAALMGLGVMTHRQIGYWRDSETMWMHSLQVTSGNFVAHDHLGEFLMSQDRIEEAFAHFQSATKIFPEDPPANLGIGVYYQAHGELQKAVKKYGMVLRVAADPVIRINAFGNLGSVFRQLGNYPQAKENFEAALHIDPDRPIALVGLGLIAQQNGNFAEAVSKYSHAMAVQPTDVGYLLLSRALLESGHPTEAERARAKAQLLSNDIAEARKMADGLLAH